MKQVIFQSSIDESLLHPAMTSGRNTRNWSMILISIGW